MAKRDYGSNTRKMAGNEQIANEVASNVNGIVYVGLAYAGKDGRRGIKVGKVSPRPKTKAKYSLSRKLFFYTVGEPSGESRKFLDWAIKSDDAKAIIEKVGFIPVD